MEYQIEIKKIQVDENINQKWNLCTLPPAIILNETACLDYMSNSMEINEC